MWWEIPMLINWDAVATALGGALLGAWLASSPAGGNVNGRQLVIPASAGHECHAELEANGHTFSFLMDTGATGHMIFGSNQASDLGLDPERLHFTQSYSSANGDGHYARIRVRQVRLSNLVWHNVPADITEAPQAQPILGLEILHALNFQLRNGDCVVTLPNGGTTVATIRPADRSFRETR
jgi:clan AA aspartic protease (TIGR02281 family)